MPYTMCPRCKKLSEIGTPCPCAAERARQRERMRVRPSPRERGYDSTYRRNRKIILADNPVCVLCGIEPATTVDHIQPVSLGIDNSLSNMRPACQRCNSSRGNRTA